MHRLWCGKDCCLCDNPCELDKSIPCSPDCDFLGKDGEFTDECVDCDCYIAAHEEV